MEEKALIEVKGLRKVYKVGSEKVVALGDINVSIHRGEIVCVLGTSGSGKSTLLNMLAGLERPSRGQVLIGGKDITRFSETRLAKFRQKNVGFVFQSYNLMNSMTALENVAMPLMFRGVGKRERSKEAKKMLDKVGLSSRYSHRPSQMSGGQQQRVGIARAFVSKPKIVFADEPTGNLDTRTTIDVMRIMVQMSRQFGLTFILVTHDQEIAAFADRIITIIDGNIVSDVPNQSIADLPDPHVGVPGIQPAQLETEAPPPAPETGQPERFRTDLIAQAVQEKIEQSSSDEQDQAPATAAYHEGVER